MLGIKSRVGLLGLLAMLLLGSYAAAPALAEGGPFWHHRNNSGEGNGVKLEKQSPEQVSGKGGLQRLLSKIGGMETEITAESVLVSGTIYNNALQAQSALQLKYIGVALVKPEGAKCEVKVGANNVVKVYGDVEWKYKGNAGELTAKPQRSVQGIEWVFTPFERVQGETAEKTEQAFTTITIGGASCPTTLKVTQQPVRGSIIGEGQPGGLEEWSRTQKIKTPEGEFWQHYWNGFEFRPWKAALKLGTEPANLLGTTETTTASQEVAVFEG